jgi:hypothetical protein
MIVVMMLFAIAVTGATGYLVVSTEFRMARYASQADEALTVARAGLQRFVAEQLGVLGDSVTYAIGDGTALVTTRKLFEFDADNHMYIVRSEGTVSDVFLPGSPATRVVGGYAYHRLRPLDHHAAVMINVPTVAATGTGTVSGTDDCGSVAPITGAIATSVVSGPVTGSPASEIWAGGFPQIYDSTGLRWDVLSDPSFPVDFEDSPPDFGALPADSFPVIRYNGNLYATSSWNGRGVLIVTGQFDQAAGHEWRGIVLAGWVDDYNHGKLDGLLVGGLGGTTPYSFMEVNNGEYKYDYCDAQDANMSLSYLELLENTVFEVR